MLCGGTCRAVKDLFQQIYNRLQYTSYDLVLQLGKCVHLFIILTVFIIVFNKLKVWSLNKILNLKHFIFRLIGGSSFCAIAQSSSTF